MLFRGKFEHNKILGVNVSSGRVRVMDTNAIGPKINSVMNTSLTIGGAGGVITSCPARLARDI